MDDMTAVTMNLYPPELLGAATEWQTSGYVYGVWCVHEPFGADIEYFAWHITHLPSGAVGFVGDDLLVMQEAARHLAEIDEPEVVIAAGAALSLPRVEPLSMEWIVRACETLKSLDIWAVAGDNAIKVSKLPATLKMSRRRRAQTH